MLAAVKNGGGRSEEQSSPGSGARVRDIFRTLRVRGKRLLGHSLTAIDIRHGREQQHEIRFYQAESTVHRDRVYNVQLDASRLAGTAPVGLDDIKLTRSRC